MPIWIISEEGDITDIRELCESCADRIKISNQFIDVECWDACTTYICEECGCRIKDNRIG